MKSLLFPALMAFTLLIAGCLESLEPEPEEPNPTGTIRGRVTYTGPWPLEDQLVDIRFVAMKYQPRTESDIFAALLTGDWYQAPVFADTSTWTPFQFRTSQTAYMYITEWPVRRAPF